MVSTTLVLSVLVIAVLGFFLIQAIAAGLLGSVEKSATVQVSAGRSSALGLSSVTVLAQPDTQAGGAVYVAQVIAGSLLPPGGAAPATTWSPCT